MSKTAMDRSDGARIILAAIVSALVFVFAVHWLVRTLRPVGVVGVSRIESSAAPGLADFGQERPPADVRLVANWIARSRDAGQRGFLVIDKKNARMYVFDKTARLSAASTVLLGAAAGDDTVPGIGARPLAAVLEQEKTTPAGRFLAERGHDARGEDVVWVDYDAGVSIHRVLTTSPTEHRLQRLASSAAEDKRISWGCINVPVAFFESYLQPMFASSRANVYILPETKTVQEVFGAYGLRGAQAIARAS